MNECGYTWKMGVVNRLVQTVIRLIERTGEGPHSARHRCTREAGHAENLATSMHMCHCMTTHWEGWNR